MRQTFILVTVAMMLLILALLGGIGCKGRIGGPARPGEPGLYIDVGHGWQQVDASKLQWHSSSVANDVYGIELTLEELDRQAFTIKRGKKAVGLAYVMTPTEMTKVGGAYWAGIAEATLCPLRQTEGYQQVYDTSKTSFFGSHPSLPPEQCPKVAGWLPDYATAMRAKEMSSSKPTEGYQCFEFTLPTASAFVIAISWGEHIYLKF